MLEHIFRNINDIRVFDVFFVEYCDGEEVDVDDILEALEYPDVERIQIEDSIEHLVKMKMLEVVPHELEGYTGCKVCLYLDKFKLPRIGEHKKHQPYEVQKKEFPYYRIALNDMTKYFFLALFESIQLHIQDELGETDAEIDKALKESGFLKDEE